MYEDSALAIAASRTTMTRGRTIGRENPDGDSVEPMVAIVGLVPKLNRLLNDLVRDAHAGGELPEDLNPAQVLLLFNLGNEEMSIRDMMRRGIYAGTNASYNLKNLVANGYVERVQSTTDRRSVRIRATRKADDIVATMWQIIARMARRLDHDGLDAPARADGLSFMEGLSSSWAGQIRNIY